ncbi:MAG: hypothetical protein ACLFWL_10105 [Candidatus Brocadiia bacterium]
MPEAGDQPKNEAKSLPEPGVAERIEPDSEHLRLTFVELRDRTDLLDEVVAENTWLLHSRDREMKLCGNLFVLEDTVGAKGWIFLRKGPLPHARPWWPGPDLRVHQKGARGFEFELFDLPDSGSDRGWEVLEYSGGRYERSKVLQKWQRSVRPSTDAHQTPRFLTNTWGDRSQDSRVCESFVSREIDAAKRLGGEVVQIDDGWQKGITGNSAKADELGGRSEAFREVDRDFWQPHPERFPNGIKPLVDKAERAGLEIGLWFAPDPGDDHANWEADARRILELHNTLGVRFFKIDGTKSGTYEADRNFVRFYRKVLTDSNGEICLDIDVTGRALRVGYLGAVAAGPIFVENRYTDWHGYWPHHTLRNLWQLARWIDPARLRMEFLNKNRNQEKYADDPLAPVHYPADTLFATTMFCNPLGWFEVSNLPEAYFETVPPLVEIWKSQREQIFGGTVVPIGGAPDGVSYTGFVSLDDAGKEGLGLIFREANEESRAVLNVPDVASRECACEMLAGGGECVWEDGRIIAEIADEFKYTFFRFWRD